MNEIWLNGQEVHSLIPTANVFCLDFGIDMFGSYALIGHCRPSDVTPVTVSSKSFAISMHNVCITNEKTKAHSPANIVWSELGKKNCCSWYVFTIAEGQPFGSHFVNSLISCFQRMH